MCKTVEPLLKFELFAKTRASHSFFMANLLKLVPQAPQTEQKKIFLDSSYSYENKNSWRSNNDQVSSIPSRTCAVSTADTMYVFG